MTNQLFKYIDNSQLIVFRIIFGLLVSLEAFGSLITGWIKITLIEPEFTFNFIGLDFLQPLPGNLMYVYYFIMGIFGLGIMFGYKYRFSVFAYLIMWSSVYFMQKASYNNHYYLMILLLFFMLIVPAHKNYSLDVKLNKNLKEDKMPNWCRLIFIIQVAIVYVFASKAKIYPDWLDFTYPKMLLESKKNLYCFNDFCFGSLLQHEIVYKSIAIVGIVFDGLIVLMLLYRPTRKIGFIASIFFHLFNAIVFQVGVFPFMSLAFSLFFFNPKTIKNIFLKDKHFYNDDEISTDNQKLIISFLSVYFLIQLILPIRHHFIEQNVLWTEEGHRLSWRMMLRQKTGFIRFKIVDKNTKQTRIVNPKKRLSKKQMRIIATKPDVIWQFAQRLKREEAEKGNDVSVYAIRSRAKVNGRKSQPFINDSIDLASIKWSALKHSDWIIPHPELK